MKPKRHKKLIPRFLRHLGLRTETEYAALALERQRLQTLGDQLSGDVSHLTSEKDDLQSKLNKAAHQNTDLQLELHEVARQNVDLQSELDEVARQNADLRQDISTLHSSIAPLRQRLTTARSSDPLRTPTALGAPLSGLKFLFIGTCQIDHFLTSAEQFGYAADHVLYDSKSYFEIPSIDIRGYDAIVIGLTFRSLLHEAIGYAMDVAHTRSSWTNAEAQRALDSLRTILTDIVGKFHAKIPSTPVFIETIIEPSFNPDGVLSSRYESTNIIFFILKLNEILSDIVDQYHNFYIYDINKAISFVGRGHLQDDLVVQFTHASMIGDWDDAHDANRLIAPVSNLTTYDVGPNLRMLHQVVFSELLGAVKTIRQRDAVKLIIVDLDDTLWRGVAADDALDQDLRTEGWPLGLVEALLYFKRRGGLLAICSKNDFSSTEQRFERIWGDRLVLDDFVSVKINWSAKSENIREILTETNLLPESAVFIDDNPREIDEVRAHFPTMRLLGGNHHDWRRIVLCSPETQVAHISEESRARTELTRARMAREDRDVSISREDWLRSLRLREKIHLVRSLSDPQFARAMELLNKTNQFNTTGRRWSLGELEAFFTSLGVMITASLSDKTVDNGLIAVSLVEGGRLTQTVLSCRVFGLSAEIALGSVATSIALTQNEQVRATLVNTGKNLTCHDYFERLGFSGRDGEFTTSAPCASPSWIELEFDEHIHVIAE